MDEQLNELEQLRQENEKLKEKNEKLYRDCVTFAKRIKAADDTGSRIDELVAEIARLKEEVAKLNAKEQIGVSFGSGYSSLDDSGSNPIPSAPVRPFSFMQESYLGDDNSDDYEDGYSEDYETGPSDGAEEAAPAAPANYNTRKVSPFITFIRVFLWIFLIFSLLVGIVSLGSFLFSTTFENYAIANYRFGTVFNSNMDPNITRDDVILIKYTDFNGIELNTPVVTTKGGRSVAILQGIDVNDGVTIATVKDNRQTYTVNEDQFVGKVVFKIPYIGLIANYAYNNMYIYLGAVVGANLVFLALLLIIPSNKKRAPKFGKDYGVDDFTI